MWIDERYTTRRSFLTRTAFGVGGAALAHLLLEEGLLANPGNTLAENLPLNLDARKPHFAPKATAMISMFMHGGPSHVDLFDPKPDLWRMNGTDYGGEVGFSFVNRASKKLFGSPWKFAKHGQCGTEVSELLPHTAGIVDDICVLRSMHTGHNGHEVSIRFFHFVMSNCPLVTNSLDSPPLIARTSRWPSARALLICRMMALALM